MLPAAARAAAAAEKNSPRKCEETFRFNKSLYFLWPNQKTMTQKIYSLWLGANLVYIFITIVFRMEDKCVRTQTWEKNGTPLLTSNNKLLCLFCWPIDVRTWLSSFLPLCGERSSELMFGGGDLCAFCLHIVRVC
jgi:hypothetical protein